jgi:twinkle protein
MNKFLRHLPCPKCKSKDNLGEYEDHFYCFGCQYYKLKHDLETLRSRVYKSKSPSNVIDVSNINTTDELPPVAMKWLLSYGITPTEIVRYNFQWCTDNGTLILLNTGNYWQGRSFKNFGPKYLSNGPKPLTTYGKSATIILVEDILSAIKVSRVQQVCSSPLLGSSLASHFEQELVNNYEMAYIWLDRDKAKNAIRIKNRLKGLGLPSKVIVTELDPKEYTTKEIEQWLKNK